MSIPNYGSFSSNTGKQIPLDINVNTSSCRLYCGFHAVKTIFFLSLLKTCIVGTRKNCLTEAVLASAHNFYIKEEMSAKPLGPC